MECVENKQFLFRWSIKNILNSNVAIIVTEERLKSPTFEVKNIGGSKWTLYLFMCKCWRRENEHLEISLGLDEHDDTSVVDRKVFLNFRFKLLSSDGEFSITSSIFNDTFKNGSESRSPLIDREDLLRRMRSWSEDTIIVLCYMENAKNASSPMIHETQDIDCEAELILVNHTRSFYCCFKFNNYEYWSESKKIDDLNITYELNLNYVNNRIQVECLPMIQDNFEQHWIDCSIDLVSDNNKKTVSKDERHLFVNNTNVHFLNSISKQQLEEAACFNNKEIRLSGEFKRIYYSIISYPQNENNREINSAAAFNTCYFPHLQRDLGNLLVDKHFTDAKLRVDNEIFPVHKCILASRSPVFLAMFNHDMVESNTGIVDICDIDTKSMNLFLEFMYTGEIQELDEEIAVSMLMLADKYQVASLKAESSEFLMSVLSVNNACNILLAADLVNLDDLKLSAVEYIAKRSKIILSSSEWSALAKNNITLATEVFLIVSNKYAKSQINLQEHKKTNTKIQKIQKYKKLLNISSQVTFK